MAYALIFLKSVPVVFTALLPLINPIGTALILAGLTAGTSNEVRRALAKKIAINTILILTTLLLVGSYILAFFGISVPIVQMAGGVVLASMGWNLLNQTDSASPADSANTPREDASVYFSRTFYPYTFPITVGPGGVAVALTLSAHAMRANILTETLISQAGALVGVIGLGIVMYFSFAYSSLLTKRLGKTGMSVLLRLIAFLVVCIGAEISWSGIRTLLLELPLHS
jgi:multiple antibiotic resistance protein